MKNVLQGDGVPNAPPWHAAFVMAIMTPVPFTSQNGRQIMKEGSF